MCQLKTPNNRKKIDEMKIIGNLTLSMSLALASVLLLNFWMAHPDGSAPTLLLNLSLIGGVFCALALVAPLFAAGMEIHRSLNLETVRTQALETVRKVRLPRSQESSRHAGSLIPRHS